MQALPEVLQAVVSGVHVPPVPQAPLQHCADDVQAWLSLVHWVAPHVPFSQTNVQQSCGIEQEAPAALQVPIDCAQIFVCGSQLALQQSALMLHVAPASWHAMPLPAAPPVLPPVPVPAPDAPPEPAAGITEASDPVWVSMLALEEPPQDNEAAGARANAIHISVREIRFMVTHSSRVLAAGWWLPAENGRAGTDRGTIEKAPLRYGDATR